MQAKVHFAACIFDAKTYQGQALTVMLHLARQLLLFFENHKISPWRIFGWPGGMRRAGGGRYEGGLRYLKDLWCGFGTPAPCLRQGRRIATRTPPGWSAANIRRLQVAVKNHFGVMWV